MRIHCIVTICWKHNVSLLCNNLQQASNPPVDSISDSGWHVITMLLPITELLCSIKSVTSTLEAFVEAMLLLLLYHDHGL